MERDPVTKLQEVLHLAYRGSAMGENTVSRAQTLFEQYAEDPAFIERVNSELNRCSAVQDRCFASRKTFAFLTSALARINKNAAH
jgi:hypothetical protein